MRSNTSRVVAIVAAICAGTAASACLGGATSLDGGNAASIAVPDDDDDDDDVVDDGTDGGRACVPSPRCARFCDEAAELGCPQEGDCCEMCEGQFERSAGCERELEALLACAPPHLAPPAHRAKYFTFPTCGLTPFHTRLLVDPDAPRPPSPSCDAEEQAYDACILDRDPALQQYEGRCHVTSPFYVREVGAPRTSANDAPDAIETAYLKCPGSLVPYAEHELKAWCDVEGWCGCYVDHEEIASCSILLHGRGMVHAPASCCAPHFDAFLGL